MKLSELVNFKGAVRYAVTVTHPNQKADTKKVATFSAAEHIRAKYAEHSPKTKVLIRMVDYYGLPL